MNSRVWNSSKSLEIITPNVCWVIDTIRNSLFSGIDLAGDLESLKKNIAKFKKGKYGGGMSDFDINDLDWIDQNSRKVKAVTIFIYETSV